MSEENRQIGKTLAADALHLSPAHMETSIAGALDEAERCGYLSGHNDGYKQGMERGAERMRERAAKVVEENDEVVAPNCDIVLKPKIEGSQTGKVIAGAIRALPLEGPKETK